MPPIPSTMVYCLENDQVLLMKRNKVPNLGLWVAPGGKVEPGESPYECALRELQEETQLVADHLIFRGLVTETSPTPDWQWRLFLYVATNFSGEMIGDVREGDFKWWPVNVVNSIEIPEADQIFFRHIINLSSPPYHAKYDYDEKINLIYTTEYPMG